MKKLGYLLGAAFFVLLGVVGGAEWDGSFWRGALPILVIVTIAIIGLIFSFFLVSWAKKRGGGGEWQRFITYGIGRRENKGRRNSWPKRQLR